jgi:hypothetical protein
MPTKAKKMISADTCAQVSKVQAKNAVNSYRQKEKGGRAKPNAYAMFVRQHMQDPKVKRLPVTQRMGAIALLWADAKKKQHVQFFDMSDFDNKPSKPKGNIHEINKARKALLGDEKKHG